MTLAPSQIVRSFAVIGSILTFVFGISNLPNMSGPESDVRIAEADFPDTLPPTVLAQSSCVSSVQASAVEDAMVQLEIQATCAAFETFKVAHQGFEFDFDADSTGRVSARIPAFFADALFTVTMESGEEMMAFVSVPDVETTQRIAVQWHGEGTDVEIHALQDDAEFGSKDHVWRHANPLETAGHDVTWMAIGDSDAENAAKVQVISFSNAALPDRSEWQTPFDISVTKANCGKAFEAKALQTNGRGHPELSNITVAIPHCDFTGEFLVLNDVFQPLQVAAK